MAALFLVISIVSSIVLAMAIGAIHVGAQPRSHWGLTCLRASDLQKRGITACQSQILAVCGRWVHYEIAGYDGADE